MALPTSQNNSNSQNWNIVNNALRGFEKEQVTKAFKGPNGLRPVIIGRLPDGEYGIQLTDGTVTTTILANGITQNDGTNDRLFLGNDS